MIEKIWKTYYVVQDKSQRLFTKYPKIGRVNSSPYLNSDTYYFLCGIRIECREDFARLSARGQDSTIYIDGNFLHGREKDFLEAISVNNNYIKVLVIGDSDFPPSPEVIVPMQNLCNKIAVVNTDRETEVIRAVPLGLESQRYKSAGQLVDFQKLPDFRPRKRDIGILVGWNDETNLEVRQSARNVLRHSPLTFEVTNRVTARYIHRLMRKSLFVACPPGNGLDTHRFWEALYLGAIPIVLKDFESLAHQPWPRLMLNSWEEAVEFSREDIERMYSMHKGELEKFRKNSQFLIQEIFREISEL
jgi:hypothetical protein